MRTKIPLAFLVLLPLVGCATFPTPEQNAAADHGPYPSNYQQIVHVYIRGTFKDPYSIRDLVIDKPSKGWMTGAPLFGERPVNYGWEIVFSVNAKNSFGAYTGAQKFDLLVRDGKLVKAVSLTNPTI